MPQPYCAAAAVDCGKERKQKRCTSNDHFVIAVTASLDVLWQTMGDRHGRGTAATKSCERK